MAKISKDLTVGNLHPRENIWATGTLGAANAEVIIDCDGATSVSVDLRGTFSLTAEVAGTVDGTNWIPIPVKPVNQALKLYVASITGTTAGVWVGSIPSYKKVRVRATAYTSGAATAYINASNAPLDQTLDGVITPALVTAVGASGAAVTLTVPNPGAGLRNYITYLSINRFAAALLLAAAAPVTVTTTGLPGTLAFSLPADAASQGTLFAWSEDFAYALAASAQNTTVTIVAPATTGVIWRVTAGYYVAP